MSVPVEKQGVKFITAVTTSGLESMVQSWMKNNRSDIKSILDITVSSYKEFTTQHRAVILYEKV